MSLSIFTTAWRDEHHSGRMDPFGQRDHLLVDHSWQGLGDTYQGNAPSQSPHGGTSQSDQVERVGHIYQQICHNMGPFLVQGVGSDHSSSAQVLPGEHSDHIAPCASSTPAQDSLSLLHLLAKASEHGDPLCKQIGRKHECR